MGLNSMMQKADGIIEKAVDRMRGAKYTYTLVTDLSVVPNTEVDLTVYLATTPTEWAFDETEGREVRATEDIFFISREYLKSGGVFFEPTIRDTFVAFGTTEPVYHVVKVEDLAEAAGTFELTVRATEQEHGKG